MQNQALMVFIYLIFFGYAGSGCGQSVLIWTVPEHGVEISGLEGHWG